MSTPDAFASGYRPLRPAEPSITHPDCVAATEAAGQLLESLGHQVEPSAVAALDDLAFTEHFLRVWAGGTGFEIDRYWPAKLGRAISEADVEPLTWALAEVARQSTVADFLASRQWLQAYSRRVAAWFEDYDILVAPPCSRPPPLPDR